MNEFIARKGIISLDSAQITGSLSVTGNISASIFSGSFVGDGSQLSGIEGFPFTGSAGITGSLTVVGPVNATTFTGDGSQLTGIEGFPFTGSAGISGSLIVVGPVNATSFTGSLQGTATSASYIQLANIDGFTAYSSSVNTAIDSVLDATTPLTATVDTGSSPFTLTSQSIVVADSTDGNLTINLPDLNTIVGTPNQKPIIVYKNDYSQNVIYVNPSGSQLVNGSTQDIIVSIQLAVIYNPTSAGWVTEGTSAQSLAELELFFLPLTETGSLATTGSNTFIGNQTVTGSLTVTGGINATITGSAASASYVEYTNVANKPVLVSGSAQISFNGITDKPTLVSGSSQITYSGISSIPSGIVSSSTQITGYNIFATTGSNQFNGSQAITGSLTITGQVVAQTLNVQQVTSSIVYSSGSNIFGNSLSNTQQFTGSVSVTGSLAVNGALTGTSATFNGIVGINGAIEEGWGLKAYENLKVQNSNGTTVLQVADTATGGKNWSLISSGTGNAHSVPAGTFYLRNSSDGLTAFSVTSTGNLGLGVTPSAWYTGYTAMQIGESAALFSNRTSADTRTTQLANNAFLNSNASNWIYQQSDEATRYGQVSGEHQWFNAPSGTAGNAITFTQAMTLTSGGKLLINSTDTTKTPLLLNSEGNYSTSGNMTTGFAITNTSFGRALNMGVFESGAYGWIQAAYINNADTTFPLLLQPRGGNVGIGTTSPTDFIDAGLGLAIINTTGRSGLSLGSTQGTANEVLGRLSFTNTNSTNIGSKRLAYISGVRGTTDNSAYLEFGTADNALGTQRMVITQGGNVGIGTASPTDFGSTYKGLSIDGAGGGGVLDLMNTGVRTLTIAVDAGAASISSRVSGNPIVLSTNNSGTIAERMRITSGGNVGIGTNNPSQKLEVVGGEIKAGRVDTTNEGGQVSFGRASDNATGWYIDVFGSTSTPALRFVDVSNSAVRMTLTGGGNVQINTTNSPLGRLHIADALVSTMLALRSNNDTSTSINFTSASPGGSSDNYTINHTIVHGGGNGYQIEHNATTRWIRMIAGSGGVELAGTATSWASISDIRTKDVLQTGISNAIDKIKNLDAIFYKYKNEELLQEGETIPEIVEQGQPSKIKQRRVGLIAQQIQEVLPEAVTYNEEEDTYRLSYTEIIPLLVESIKEQQTQIESLKAEIQTLKQ